MESKRDNAGPKVKEKISRLKKEDIKFIGSVRRRVIMAFAFFVFVPVVILYVADVGLTKAIFVTVISAVAGTSFTDKFYNHRLINRLGFNMDTAEEIYNKYESIENDSLQSNIKERDINEKQSKNTNLLHKKNECRKYKKESEQSSGKRNWYYSDRVEKHGPISRKEIETKIQFKKIGKDDLVWRDGMDQWQIVEDVFDISSGPPPLPSE